MIETALQVFHCHHTCLFGIHSTKNGSSQDRRNGFCTLGSGEKNPKQKLPPGDKDGRMLNHLTNYGEKEQRNKKRYFKLFT